MSPALDRERAKGKAQALIRCHCPTASGADGTLLAGAPERSRLSRKYQTRPDEAFVRGSFFGGGTMCTDGNMELDGSTNRRSRGEEEKSRKAERSLALEPGLAGLVPHLPPRALVLFEFFDAAFNDLGEAYGAAFPLRGLV
jgi:hypothetical protein